MKPNKLYEIVDTEFRIVDGPDVAEIREAHREILAHGACGKMLSLPFQIMLMARLRDKKGVNQPDFAMLWRPLWREPLTVSLILLHESDSPDLNSPQLADLQLPVMLNGCVGEAEFLDDILQNPLASCTTIKSFDTSRLYYDAKNCVGVLRVPEEPKFCGYNTLELKPWANFRKDQRPTMRDQNLYTLARFRNSQTLNHVSREVEQNLKLFKSSGHVLEFCHDMPKVQICPYPIAILKAGDIRKLGKGSLVNLKMLAVQHGMNYDINEMGLQFIGKRIYSQKYYEPYEHFRFLGQLTKDAIEEYNRKTWPEYGCFAPKRHRAGTLVTIDYDCHNYYGVVMYHDYERGLNDQIIEKFKENL